MSGYTSLQVGLHNVDPVNGQAQGLSGTQARRPVRWDSTALVTLGMGLGKAAATLDLSFTSVPNFRVPSGLQAVGESASCGVHADLSCLLFPPDIGRRRPARRCPDRAHWAWHGREVSQVALRDYRDG